MRRLFVLRNVRLLQYVNALFVNVVLRVALTFAFMCSSVAKVSVEPMRSSSFAARPLAAGAEGASRQCHSCPRPTYCTPTHSMLCRTSTALKPNLESISVNSMA